MIQGFGTFARDGVTHLGFRAGDLVVDLGEGSLDEMCLEIFGIAVNAPPQTSARMMPTPDELPLDLMKAMNVD